MCLVKSMEVFLQHWNLREGKISGFITANCITLILGIFRPCKLSLLISGLVGMSLLFLFLRQLRQAQSLQSRSENL